MSLSLQFLNKTSRYAIAATTALASLEPGGRMSSGELAERTQAPRAFLGKVMTQLARAGLVEGAKGHGGGYRLARHADSIVLAEVIEATSDDSGADFDDCPLGVAGCEPDNPCGVHDRWTALQDALEALLGSVTVADAAVRGVTRGNLGRARA
jgi:Rrf2 family iron-sulfur cluster assembly transcriptional regulator